MYECKRSDQYDTADVPTYEEVTTYRRKHGDRHRLVVLVGKCDKFGVFFAFI